MNGVATFRLCKLSNDDLIKKVDSGTDEMFKTGKIPTRNIPARPDEDYDLLVGEMIYRFDEQSARIRELEGLLDKTVNLLLKMPDEINDFELIEEAENALSTSETEAKYGEVGSQLELQFQPDD